MISILSLTVFLSTSSLAVDLSSQDPVAFEMGLNAVERSMAKGQWSQAGKSLHSLLANNERASYVYAEKLRIMNNMEMIDLYEKESVPTVNDVLLGDVKRYDAVKGKIDVIYSGPEFGDFRSISNGGYIFPPRFTGPYFVEIQGSKYPYADDLQISIDWKTPNQWRVGFGSKKMKPYVSEVIGSGVQDQFITYQTTRPLDPSKPFKVSVDVSNSRVTAKANKKPLFAEKRKNAEYGVLVIFGADQAERGDWEVHMKGPIDPTWIAEKIESAMAVQMESFSESYIAADHLPSWLFEVSKNALASSAAAIGGPHRSYPGAEMGAEAETIFSSFDLSGGLTKPNLDLKLREIDAAQVDKGLHDVAADCLRMQLLLVNGRVDEAAVAGARMVAAAPDHHGWVLSFGEILMLQKDYDQARAVLEPARMLWPQSAAIFEALTNVEIQARRWGAAQGLVEEARLRREFDSETGAELQEKFNKAIFGPGWRHSYTYESAHFLVESNVSTERCEYTANLLESTYSNYEEPMLALPNFGANKLRVFVFANEARYDQYISEDLVTPSILFNGTYQPFLRQLVVWDNSEYWQFEQVVVHEGFHQYFHMLAFNPPRWYEEGLALVMDWQGVVDGAWTTRAVRQDLIQYLLEGGFKPLKEFVALTDAAYLDDPDELLMCQAWAFLDFLRVSTAKEQEIFDALYQGFTSSTSRQQVLEAAFALVDMDDLDRRFLNYLQARE